MTDTYEMLATEPNDQTFEKAIEHWSKHKWFDPVKARRMRVIYQRTKPGTHLLLDGEPAMVYKPKIHSYREMLFVAEHPNAGVIGTGCALESDKLLADFREALLRIEENPNKPIEFPIFMKWHLEALQRIKLEMPENPLDYEKWSNYWGKIWANS